jgi:hypothetical protein
VSTLGRPSGRARSIDAVGDATTGRLGDGGAAATPGPDPVDRVFEEVAFVAYHFNWAHDDVLAMPHWERRRWCGEISRINERMNEERP